MDTTSFNFTKLALQKIETSNSSAKRVYYKDTQVKGLILDVRASGTKSFYLYKKILGKPERIFLGLFPDMSVEVARKQAFLKLADIAIGKNPQDELRKAKNEYTFEKLFEEYMERYSKKHKRSWKYDEREVHKFLTHWFKRKISTIRKSEVQKLIEKVHDENGLYQANRLLERIRHIFNKAIEWGYEGINPALGIKKYRGWHRCLEHLWWLYGFKVFTINGKAA